MLDVFFGQGMQQPLHSLLMCACEYNNTSKSYKSTTEFSARFTCCFKMVILCWVCCFEQGIYHLLTFAHSISNQRSNFGVACKGLRFSRVCNRVCVRACVRVCVRVICVCVYVCVRAYVCI